MKDYTKEELEAVRPNEDADKAIDYCLSCLYDDKRAMITHIFADGATYEELIGALLLARDKITELTNEVESLNETTNGRRTSNEGGFTTN